MDHPSFDALTQRIAGQTTRRSALAVLLGGLLLFNDLEASDANRRARRRRRRQRRQRRLSGATGPGLKPISLRIDNTAGTNRVIVEHAEVPTTSCCQRRFPVSIPAGETRLFQASSSTASVWIANKYWLGFKNPLLARPVFGGAVGGQAVGWNLWLCCLPDGTTVVQSRSMDEGQTVPITMAAHTFSITRNRDSNYKEFTVKLPAGL